MIPRRVYEHVKAHNWFAVAIDFVIVVAGILIAFQITEWNDVRKDRNRERAYLARIAGELDESIPAIEHAIQRAEERGAYGELLIRTVEDPELVRADPAAFIKAALFAGYTLSPEIRSQTFDEIKSAGDLNILSDEQLRFDLTEFYTEIDGAGQWNYSRELKQNEYTKRSAGVLTLDQLRRVGSQENAVEASVEEASAAYQRMIDRPSFLEWLPIMADRTDDIATYAEWLATARDLRARIRATPGVAPARTEKDATP